MAKKFSLGKVFEIRKGESVLVAGMNVTLDNISMPRIPGRKPSQQDMNASVSLGKTGSSQIAILNLSEPEEKVKGFLVRLSGISEDRALLQVTQPPLSGFIR
ncbi:MAG: hypothetical protein HY367_03085 [Candidatus Aenigmarchaeota archaeon]|nr:hypothetical protein [Candidatus Aenigmarchaeota archaeon]